MVLVDEHMYSRSDADRQWSEEKGPHFVADAHAIIAVIKSSFMHD